MTVSLQSVYICRQEKHISFSVELHKMHVDAFAGQKSSQTSPNVAGLTPTAGSDVSPLTRS